MEDEESPIAPLVLCLAEPVVANSDAASRARGTLKVPALFEGAKHSVLQSSTSKLFHTSFWASGGMDNGSALHNQRMAVLSIWSTAKSSAPKHLTLEGWISVLYLLQDVMQQGGGPN